MRRFLRRFVLAACAFAVTSAWAAELRPFDAKSLAAIRQANAGKPFVLVFWSLYCDPCRQEMAQWGPLQRQYPGVPILLVATDSANEQALVRRFLAQHRLGKVQTWAFADEFSERVRFSVDRGWRGELPRTYLFDGQHRPEAHSGRISRKSMETWLAKQARSPAG